MTINAYLGIDVGSVTTKAAIVDETGKYIDGYMTRTAGKPVVAVQKSLQNLMQQKKENYNILGVGTTGSGRNLAGALVGADVVKNEITAHAVAASTYVPGVQTILEIGGQDSKIIILSFLDQQASRLNVAIQDFGEIALKSQSPARIAGRCGVFAESDLIHKQQLGYPVEDLLYGLCQALVRNYLSNLALGKEILPIVTFQGGVATNSGMVKAFEEALNTKVVVPDNHQTMGAIGAALLAMENHQFNNTSTKFKGFEVGEMSFNSYTNQCSGCSNNCEVITIIEGEVTSHEINNKSDKIIARWGGTCGRWDIG